MEFDLEDPLAGAGAEGWWDDEEASLESYRLESVESLLAAESDHVSSLRNLEEDLPLRRDAVSLLVQAQDTFCLDPFVVYLATNYVDRFLSRETISRDKPWIVGLLAISCLSLACKMKKMEFTVADFLAAEGLAYDGQTVRRMELFVLRVLDWRMRSITPFCFLPPLIAALKARASEIIFRAQNEMKLLDCKPSVAAASALLTASHALFPCRGGVGLLRRDGGTDGGGGCGPALEAAHCDTPVTVLRHHRHCSSSESEGTVAGDCSPLGGDAEKRRAGGLAGDCRTVFLSPAAGD
ncbi:unnamed protein product [Spirodela intermedia]|uniref:Cyclin-like domain-containing protein n=1 Tax=Spirodela intermedia TaxID=51605 RepID=A0A7I8IMN1_SPIIN|nr:unnamed protein product [Spirodela intermedia]CAA6658396.1 unnamed protein product [Spirodela intermedia]